MTQKNDPGQGAGRAPQNRTTEPVRAERLRAALRYNLARRKAQARRRVAADGDLKDDGDTVAQGAGHGRDRDGT